jgi:CHAD domain-containing protein
MLGECFDPDDVHAWGRQLKELRKGLGPARDCDVQIKFLKGVRKDTSQRDQPGVDLLLKESKKQRKQLQSAVSKAAEKLRKSGTLKDVDRRMKDALSEWGNNHPLLTEPVFLRCRDAIKQRLDALMEKDHVLKDPEDHEGHHQMRIAAKHLRYTFEIARPALGDPVAPMQDAAEHMQDLLGEVHDCDVWVDHLQELLAGEGPTLDETTRPGVEMLSNDRREHREEMFEQARTFWARVLDEGRPDCLRGYLHRDPAEVVPAVNV